jgi:hypothetical protein
MLKLLSLFRPKEAPARRPNRANSARGGSGPGSTDAAGGAPRAAADWERLRSPQREQDLVLADHVLAWLQQLPQPVRPSELCTRYPRVANRIALCWSDPMLTEQVFDALLLSQRGKRRGFPPNVAAEMLRLRAFHSRHKGTHQGVRMWDRSEMAVSDR